MHFRRARIGSANGTGSGRFQKSLAVKSNLPEPVGDMALRHTGVAAPTISRGYSRRAPRELRRADTAGRPKDALPQGRRRSGASNHRVADACDAAFAIAASQINAALGLRSPAISPCPLPAPRTITAQCSAHRGRPTG